MERPRTLPVKEHFFLDDMKKFFYSHPDVVIASLAILFLGILIASYIWTINNIFFEAHRALTSSMQQTSGEFNLAAAAQLGLSSSSVSSTAIIPLATSTAAPLPVNTGTSTPATLPPGRP